MLKPRMIDVPLDNGLGQSRDEKSSEPGTLRRSENFVVDHDGRIALREGYSETMIYSGDSFNLLRVAGSEQNKIMIRDSLPDSGLGGVGKVLVNFPGAGVTGTDWKDLGTLPTAPEITDRSLTTESLRYFAEAGCASANGITLYAGDMRYSSGATAGETYRLKYVVCEDKSGNRQPISTISTGSDNYCKVFRWGDKLCIIYISSTSLKIFRYDSITGATDTLTVPSEELGYSGPLDVSWNSADTQCYIVVNRLSPGEEEGDTFTRLLRLETAGTLTNDIAISTVSSSSIASSAIYVGATRVIAAWSASTETLCRGWDKSLANPTPITATLASYGAANNLVVVPLETDSQYNILWSHLLTDAFAPTGYTITSHRRFRDTDGAVSSTIQNQFPFLSPASKPFAKVGYNYYIWFVRGAGGEGIFTDDWTGLPSGFDRSYVLYLMVISGTTTTFKLAGRASHRVCAGTSYVRAVSEVAESESTSGIPNGIFRFCGSQVYEGDVRLKTHTDLHEYVLDMGSWDRMQVTDHVSSVISGALPREYPGMAAGVNEIGHATRPDRIILYSTASTGGYISDGVYQYKVTWEFSSIAGTHRSEPSLPFQVTLTGGTSTQANEIEVESPTISVSSTFAVVRLWRTKAGPGDIFYLVAEETPGAPSTVLTDTTPDSELTSKEALYTSSGELPDYMPPSFTAATQHKRRLFVGHDNLLYYSKENRPGTTHRFVEDWYIVFPERITALASRDEALVVMTETSIWVVYGDGPDLLGQGQFNPPQQIATTLGCPQELGGQRSVCATEHGIVFRSRRGIALLPSNLGPPVIISDPAGDELSEQCVTSAVATENQTVKFTIADVATQGSSSAGILVWDFSGGLPGRWYQEKSSIHRGISSGVLWTAVNGNTNYCFGSIYNDKVWEQTGHTDDTANITGVIETNAIYPWGHSTEGRLYKVMLTGTRISDADIDVEVSYDGGSTWTSTSLGVTMSSSQPFEFRPARQRFCGVMLRYTQVSDTAGFAINSISLYAAPRNKNAAPVGSRFA